jgi:hypothetical protein
VFERAKTFRALDRADTVFGILKVHNIKTGKFSQTTQNALKILRFKISTVITSAFVVLLYLVGTWERKLSANKISETKWFATFRSNGDNHEH